MEARFSKNVKANKRHVVDNALRAQASLNIVNDLYRNGADSDAGSGLITTTPAARAAIEMMNKTSNQHLLRMSTSQPPLNRGDDESASKVSAAGKDATSEVRRRML